MVTDNIILKYIMLGCRYDRMPHDFFVLDVPPMIDQSGQLSYPVSANKTAANVFTTLSRYLYHRRWVWTMQHVSSMPISMQAVGCILSNLTKYVILLSLTQTPFAQFVKHDVLTTSAIGHVLVSHEMAHMLA